MNDQELATMSRLQRTAPPVCFACASRKGNGWIAVLEFPNGGRIEYLERFSSYLEAQRDAVEKRTLNRITPDIDQLIIATTTTP